MFKEKVNARTDGCTDGRTDGRTQDHDISPCWPLANGRTDGRTDRRTRVLANLHVKFQDSRATTYGRTDGRTDRRTRDINRFAHLRGTNILVKNVNARVFTNKMWTDGQRTKTNPKTSPEQSAIFQLAKNVTSIENCPTPPNIYKTNLFTKFHDEWAKIHVIQLTGTIFQLNSHIKKTNENWAKNVTSRVFTCFHYIHIEKNAPPTGGHVFSPIWTIFELYQ
ncbi:hypothetical protein DPMN_165113 [Dreissena polymorpha]|uniref:Uncharacterized protein n=1 Tax=Dreissena polymorpha TaxID=45954 RepID=A0A9D4IW26_DREPO|nr:hypothetical protein DPMN_165113 [Dreissena polymorpha]